MTAKRPGYACPRCTVGRCTPQRTTFTDMLQDQLLSIPNVPAHICDVCNLIEFDQDLLDTLWECLYKGGAREDIAPAVPSKRSPSFGES
ncbi:MAG: hypothetical protein OXG92_05750 [Chloroflexi bacterium]|nr:hypothetical protein [Chloroflexota bacterium]MCY3583212.1 hypothetical protein [Chloroflexota bacterium]MCY3715951.1 hypothetical protein [Chloroflexota bacterium]MDE2651522.1 hypothetical protein [Chloroflexota bacterium]MXX50257.1 hypothetical protein [Chloroflexota bacterium]